MRESYRLLDDMTRPDRRRSFQRKQLFWQERLLRERCLSKEEKFGKEEELVNEALSVKRVGLWLKGKEVLLKKNLIWKGEESEYKEHVHLFSQTSSDSTECSSLFNHNFSVSTEFLLPSIQVLFFFQWNFFFCQWKFFFFLKVFCFEQKSFLDRRFFSFN